ncbi:HK97-gp10 family putative phage morphogenesis protein [Marinobacter sp. JSM 1782161]|uniref:HK97-gp10 family putative phage morphogenesis protein n=1 Tax=Marinobacter sp. JSM 1782161 TaxID=2685906 RepID=UPI0014033328|nr:HK97-gp10 family putative phage morphogenesis protein [Marinobacter sp. JSM 1782161]
MADGVEFSLIGLDSLQSKLDAATYDMKRRGGRFALRKAAQVLKRQVQQNAKRLDDPQSAADISENVAERWSGRTFKRTGNLAFRVGIMGGAGGSKSASALSTLPGGDTRHWRHLEFGTERARAQPFMRPAMDQAAGAIINEFADQYEKALVRAIRRANRKASG